MQQIQALRFEVDQVGKHVKGSKKRYCWEIALKDKAHTIVLDFSFISGKVKITVDRKILLENELPANVSFQYPFTLDGFALNIIQQGETFQLRINNKVFSHLYTQHKTNTEFKKYEEEIKDIKVDLNHLQNKQKVSLNIGGLPANKKKKEVASESHDWNAFSSGSFPNYFGDQPAQPTAQPPSKSSLLDDEQVTASKLNQQFSLLQAPKSETAATDNSFDLMSSQSVSKSNSGSQEQDLFSSLTGTATGAGISKSGEIDFFAEDPKPVEVKEEIKQKQNVFSFNEPITGLSGFGTGFGLQGNSQVNPKNFTTTTSKDFNLNSIDFMANLKQEPVGGPSFSKKSVTEAVNYGQVEAFSLDAPSFQPQTQPQLQPQPQIQQQPQIQPQQQFQTGLGQSNFNINDFNTMQRMFQTGVPNQQELSFGSVSQPVQNPISFSSIQAPTPKESDFSTMQLMFQTNSLSQPQPQFQLPSNPQPQPQLNLTSNPQPQLNLTLDPKPQQNPLDFFQNNKPASFSTLSGGSLGNNYDISLFATTQPKPKGTVELNFFDSKPAPKVSQASNDLI